MLTFKKLYIIYADPCNYNDEVTITYTLRNTWSNLAKSIGSIPVTDLDYAGDILKEPETRQFVKAVDFF